MTTLRDVAIDEIEERHLLAQVELGVPEVRTVEYKSALPEKSGTAEFLADVCSFANAGGGDLVYGVEEEAGTPTALTGVEMTDPDAEILRLESVILSGINPRIPGLRSRYVPLSETKPGRHALVIRIPRSFGRSPAGPRETARRRSRSSPLPQARRE